MKNLPKKIVTLVLALAVLAGTLFIESGLKIEAMTPLEQEVLVVTGDQGATLVTEAGTETLVGERSFQPGDTFQTSNGQTALVRFDDHAIIRLAPLSALTFKLQSEEGFVFELNQGQVWMNNLSSVSRVNLLAGGALVIPRRSSFDTQFDGQTTEVRVFSGQVNVGLVTDVYVVDRVALPRDETQVNSFLVAQGSRAVVSFGKVINNADLLRQLLYSKLIKEFQYSLMDPALLVNDGWIAQNLQADKDLRNEISSEVREEITSRGLHYSSLDGFGYDMDKALIGLSDILTFTDEKKTERRIQNIFEQLLDAEYLFEFGRNTEGQERIILFGQLVAEGINQRGELFTTQALDKVTRSYAHLQFVLPVDSLFAAKVQLSDLMIAQLNGSEDGTVQKLGLIRDYMDYAYTLADTNQLEARLSVEQYFRRFQDFVKNERTYLARNSRLLSEENQIMDNLLRQYPQFYQESFFTMKDFLEEEFLDLLPEGPAKNEERQTIISTKIDFLKQLQSFFLDEQVSLNDARLIAFRLINEIKDLQPDADLGVSQLFALRLKDYGTFLKFLNTTDVGQLRGSSPQTEYDSFLATQKEQISLEQVIQEFLGEEVTTPTVTAEEILGNVVEDFEKLGAINLELAPISDPNQEIIYIVNGELDGVQFSGEYDWKRKLISQVRSNNRLLSRENVRLSSLGFLLQPKEETVTPPVEENPSTPPVEVSQAERVAKILLLQKMTKSGIVVEEQNVVVRDLEAGDFVINGATLVNDPNVQMAFAFQNKTNVVSSLIVRTSSEDLRIPDSYVLLDLAAAAQQIYNEALPVEEEIL